MPQDKILKLLRESEGNILDDEQLLNTLNNSKRTSAAIQVQGKVQYSTVIGGGETPQHATRERYKGKTCLAACLYVPL